MAARGCPLDLLHRTWADLVTAYQPIDQGATAPIHQRLVEHDLGNTGAQLYQDAARLLANMRQTRRHRRLLRRIDTDIAELRDHHRRRPRLQHEFDKAQLP